MIRALLFPDWCYVVRSDRCIVTIPPTSRLRRIAHRLLLIGVEAAAIQMWAQIGRLRLRGEGGSQ